MTFANALQRALAKQGETIEIPDTQMCETNPEDIPMMYRAQISGRCSLQYAGSKDDRDRWTEELVDPKERDSSPRHQHPENSKDTENIVKEGCFLRLTIPFPWRVFTNCGQDSIARPVLDVRGIPHIPGSSIKGLFRRRCQQRDKSEPEKVTNRYCGDKENVTPGILRFHGAYPVGDWAGTIKEGKPDGPSYRMVDVVHPQEDWQIGKPSRKKNASALISLYQPTLVFEISSTQVLSQEEWNKIAGIFRTALSQGLGGKTNSGYGLAYQPQNRYYCNAYLIGQGSNPVLLSKDPEFRPNIFKSTLRGHTRRLLAGCLSSEPEVDSQVEKLFGCTDAPARVEIYWDGKLPSQPASTYNAEGTLRMSAPEAKEKELLKLVFQFAYTMGGFGKSWRRVWHEKFYQPIYQEKHGDRRYDKDIGCHWEADDDWLREIQTPEQLTAFLDRLQESCKKYCSGSSQPTRRPNNSPANRPTRQPQLVNWRETWHRDRVTVYAAVTERSRAIELFHDRRFKTTPAIGGKNPGDQRPKYVSSVWHRMLPISAKQYLEIVTVFHGDRSQWRSNGGEGNSQLQPFIKELDEKKLKFIWGANL